MELLVLVADAGWYDPNPTPKFHEIPRIFTVVHNYGSHFVAQIAIFFAAGRTSVSPRGCVGAQKLCSFIFF